MVDQADAASIGKGSFPWTYGIADREETTCQSGTVGSHDVVTPNLQENTLRG